MNTSLAANASSLPRLESDLYESVVDKDGRYGGVIADERWAQEIKRLARERNAVILAHNYQLPEIQDIPASLRKPMPMSSFSVVSTSWRKPPKF